MIIKSVTVSDFRVFRGEHSFDLEPRIKYGKKRPIVLFGGLNGAGKTSILAAIKLALYGKHSLGGIVAQKNYDTYLIDSIHRGKDTLIQSQHAAVAVSFSYAQMGVVHDYKVERTWQISGKSVDEYIHIYEDEKLLTELNMEQCQGFLNELIPVGVSELFFFDGEKIKELAEDTGGAALGTAIKRLLGLDIIDSLQTDLSTLLRQQRESKATSQYISEVKELKKKLDDSKKRADQSEQKLGDLRSKYIVISEDIQGIEQKLSEQGGAWAKSRESETQSLQDLELKRKELEEECRELISSAIPLGIAKSLQKKLDSQLASELELNSEQQYEKQLLKRVDRLKKKLSKEYTADTVQGILSAVDKTLFSHNDSTTKVIHDLSASKHDSYKKNVQQASIEATSLKSKNDILKKTILNIDKKQANLARAPEQSGLQKLMDKLLVNQKKKGSVAAEYAKFYEDYRRSIREAIDCTRKLKKLENSSFSEARNTRVNQYAQSSKTILSKFSKQMAERKIRDLEREFLHSITKLARKSDMDMRAKINPSNFSVDLVRKDGSHINKNELSAGEKQIYAIAILEALARTSGRKLPIIIDTPLGRLDSKHRENLVKHYFPHASHQVIILSTDTEIDKDYVNQFSTHLSHAFKLNYNKNDESTTATEGYFWRINENEVTA